MVQSPVCPRVWGSGCSRVEHRLLDIDAGRHTQVQAEVPSGARQWNVVVVGVGVRDTLLGPEGSDDTHVLVTVALGVAGCWWVCAGWFLLVVGLTDARVFARVGVGCRLYVENFTVDASIFSSVQVFKGTRWMPWHQEPKKDVGICDKPRGVDNQTVIRGFPNGETRLEASPVTRT